MTVIEPTHPMQPVVLAADGIERFKANAIVQWLLDRPWANKISAMNTIAATNFSDEDRCQFAQLIGYSVSGYGDLSYTALDAGYDGAGQGNSDAECIVAASKLARSANEHETEHALRDLLTTIENILDSSPAGLRFSAAERATNRTPEQEAEREQLIFALVEVDGEDRDEAARRVDIYLARKTREGSP